MIFKTTLATAKPIALIYAGTPQFDPGHRLPGKHNASAQAVGSESLFTELMADGGIPFENEDDLLGEALLKEALLANDTALMIEEE